LAPLPLPLLAGAAMVRFREAEAAWPLASITPTLYVLVPELIGMPERTPAGLKLRPALQTPEQLLIAQL
jgi:hypothetical protein